MQSAEEKSNKLRTEVAMKNQEISDLRSELAKQKDAFAVRGANMEETKEQEMWAMQARFDQGRTELLKEIEALERSASNRGDELRVAEDHIQELERQLSDAESLNHTMKVTMETCSAEVEMCQSDVAAHKARADDAERRAKSAEDCAASAERDALKMDEKLAGLRAILADYEVELEETKRAEQDLRSERSQVQKLSAEISKLQDILSSCEEDLRQEKARTTELDSALSEAKRDLEQNEESMQERANKAREMQEAELLLVKQEAEENLKKMFDSNKQKLVEVAAEQEAERARIVEAHAAEVAQLQEEYEWKSKESNRVHR